MKRIFALITIFITLCPVTARAVPLIPGGSVVGLEVRCGTVTVAAFEEDSPAEAAGLRAGDRLLTVNGRPIDSTEDVRAALNASHGFAELQIRRGKEDLTIRLRPAITADGPKLGAYLKQGITGIGTVTFIDPQSGTFAALGHAVSTPEGTPVTMDRGFVYDARILSVRRGKAGDPGRLVGSISSPEPLGTLSKNTPQGIFGTLKTIPKAQTLETAARDEIRPGPAIIRSNIHGREVREYSVEILRIYPTQKEGGRNLLLKVTDPALLEATGGIVQGMSGSPIIQNGRLIGAVTHVLVNDPTTGYGIFIENMLDAAA